MSKNDDAFLNAIEKLNKTYGQGTIIGGENKKENYDVISTGSLTLDQATGIGGLPRGHIVELMGWESSGKSTITLQTIANAQRDGLRAVLVDGEHSFDRKYATNLGVKMEELYISQPDYGEQGYQVVEDLLDTNSVQLVVIDSQTSLLPKAVMEGDAGDSRMGLHARMLSIEVPKIMAKAAKANALVIFVSQFREKIGVIYGNPTTTNGGHAIKFYAHMRIEISKSVKKEEHLNRSKAKVVKNKLAEPYGEAEFNLVWGKGVDRMQEVLDLAVEKNIITRAGSWYSYGDVRLGQGEDNVKALFLDNEEVYEAIEQRVLSAMMAK